MSCFGLKPSSTPSLRGALARRWKAWLIVAVLAVAAAVSVYALFGRSSNTVRYVTEPVTRSDLHVTVTATGSVQPTNQVEVSSECPARSVGFSWTTTAWSNGPGPRGTRHRQVHG